LSLEVRDMFKRDLGASISAEKLHSDVTVAGLFEMVSNAIALAPAKSIRPPGDEAEIKLVSLQKGDKHMSPLILFHDGSGSFSAYSKLGTVGSPVSAVANPSLGKSKTWAPGLEHMADQYAQAIANSIKGPIVLGGKQWNLVRDCEFMAYIV
jgi:pimeloyl-ACP methyl ester carboxylesterase